MNDPFEIQVQKGDFSLKMKGFKPLSQVGQYVADAIGVVGEPLGYLKDSLHKFRIHRESAAAAAMIRAKQIADQRGEKLTTPSPKFLAPWIEAASYEDLDSENILEIWALLLAGAGENFDPLKLAFIEICKKIGPKEARIFAQQADIFRMGISSIGQNGPERSFDSRQMRHRNDSYLKKMLPVIVRAHKTNTTKHQFFHVKVEDCLPLVNERIAGSVTRVFWELDNDGPFSSGGVGSDINTSLEVLVFSGAMTKRDFTISDNSSSIDGSIFEFTEIGAEFFKFLNSDFLIIRKSHSDFPRRQREFAEHVVFEE